MSSPLLTLSYIKRFWLPYIDEHPECVSWDYWQVIRRFPKADPRSMRALFDKEGMLQAAAVVDIDRSPLFLELLLTAPWRQKGSGSTLLFQIVRESVKVGSKGAIELMAAPTAISFYEKYGFTITKPVGKPGWDTPMRLSSSAARQLLRSLEVEDEASQVGRIY
jgi:GNAT superfamily N-acetyltransferase